MANLKDIRNRIKSVKSIQQVTGAMKMVAAAKMRKAQGRMEEARPYSKRLTGVIQTLLVDIDRTQLHLLDVREVKRKSFVVVTSDRGLAAAFNTNIIKKAEKEITAAGKDNSDVFCIGKKGYDYFRRRDYNIIESHVEFWSGLNFDHAIKIGNGIISHFINGNVDEIHVIYNEFKNVATQILRSEKLLPLIFDDVDPSSSDILYEPSKESIIVSLVPRFLNIQVWKYLLESYASEQAARMVAMENATENAKEMINNLQLAYNKARQSSITTEMLEIVSGAEALTN